MHWVCPGNVGTTQRIVQHTHAIDGLARVMIYGSRHGLQNKDLEL